MNKTAAGAGGGGIRCERGETRAGLERMKSRASSVDCWGKSFERGDDECERLRDGATSHWQAGRGRGRRKAGRGKREGGKGRYMSEGISEGARERAK